MPDAYADIRYRVQDHVATLTLDRPAKLNAWTPAMEKSVARALQHAAQDAAVRVIVLTGAGRGFCAGADMQRLQGATEVTPSDLPQPTAAEAGRLTAVEESELAANYRGRFGYLLAIPKPIIAAINGPCAGIGLVLSLFCDLRFARTDAKLTTAFAQRGLIAEHGIAWILPRLIGPAHALDLLLSARPFSGSDAERLGLVNRAFAPESFEAEVQAYVQRLSREVSPRSLGIMKTQIWKALFQRFDESTELADREMLESFKSADFKEGVAHFVEKRAPRFTGS